MPPLNSVALLPTIWEETELHPAFLHPLADPWASLHLSWLSKYLFKHKNRSIVITDVYQTDVCDSAKKEIVKERLTMCERQNT